MCIKYIGGKMKRQVMII